MHALNPGIIPLLHALPLSFSFLQLRFPNLAKPRQRFAVALPSAANLCSQDGQLHAFQWKEGKNTVAAPQQQFLRCLQERRG